MTTANSILEERFARGEITESEFDRLKGKIVGKTAAAASGKPGKSFFTHVGEFIGGAVIVLVVIGWIAGGKSSGLKFVEGNSTNGNVTVKVVNESSKSEDMVVWLVQNGINKCTHVTRMKPKRAHTLRFHCGSIKTGTYNVRFAWASSEKAKAAAARRIPLK